MHHVVLPLPFVLPVVLPDKETFPLKLILSEVAFIRTPIGPLKPPVFLLPSMEIPSENSTIRPVLFTHPLLHVTSPFSLTKHSLIVTKLTHSASLTKLPPSIIVVLVWMHVDPQILKIVIPKVTIVVSSACKVQLSNSLNNFDTVTIDHSTSVVADLDFGVLLSFKVQFFKLSIIEALSMSSPGLEITLSKTQFIDCFLHPLHQVLQIIKLPYVQSIKHLNLKLTSPLYILNQRGNHTSPCPRMP